MLILPNTSTDYKEAETAGHTWPGLSIPILLTAIMSLSLQEGAQHGH